MRFGLLGPLAVWTADGRPVRIREVKVRALLANLLVHAGHVVPADRLVDHLWGERLPARPAGALQSRVSQLRHALEQAEPGGRALVESRPPGYVLRPGAIDVDEFRQLTERASATADPAARATLLSDALALWRGPALGDFADEPFARAAAARLEELRLTAMEDLARVRLELGEHAAVTAELAELVAHHPLRERLTALHMRALYRSGRQDEALRSYDRLRTRLADELGTDPTPELAALHQAILTQDPALAAPPRTNLPVPLTTLVGRDADLDHVCAVLRGSRLVTLTGPGGVGKTRLAVEAASHVVKSFPDGAWLIELTGRRRADEHARSLADVVETVTATLGVRDEATAGAPLVGEPAPLLDRLAAALRGKNLLLLLDNCEHVVEPVAELAERLLAAAPGLRILATSQEPVGLPGEVVVPVRPLALPDSADRDPAALREFGAVELFVTRAAAADPGFTFDTANAGAVVAICRRLDALPLALELAATRVRALDVPTLAERLDDRFRLLDTGRRGGPARQQTLRAMIDWGWELLSEAERVVLRRLAVHTGGCTLDAAEAVCAGDGVRATEVLGLLTRLVDRSLVVMAGSQDGPPRYQLLESVAAYCVDRLREAGELDRVRTRHSEYYTVRAERAEPHLRGREQRRWLRRLDVETPNLRTASEDAARRGDAGRALRLATALAWYWVLRGRLGEGHRTLGAALSAAGPAPEGLRATASTWRTAIACRLGDRAALTDTIEESTVDSSDSARAQWFLSLARIGFDQPETSERLIERALTTFRTLGDRWGVAAALSSRARLALNTGDLAALRRDGERSTALFEELGDQWGMSQGRYLIGSLAEITGDYPRAAWAHRHGMRLAEELELWTDVADRLTGLGRIALLRRDYPLADELHERAARLAATQGYVVGEELAELGLALSARRQGDLDRAERTLRRWLSWNQDRGSTLGLALILAELGFVAERRGDASAALDLHAAGLAAARETGDPRAIALALEGLAGAHSQSGEHGRAARLLGSATAIRESTGAPLPPAERDDVDRVSTRVRAALGEHTYTDEFTAGTTELLNLPSKAG